MSDTLKKHEYAKRCAKCNIALSTERADHCLSVPIPYSCEEHEEELCEKIKKLIPLFARLSL